MTFPRHRTSTETPARTLIVATLIAGFALAAGCDRNTEPYVPGEKPQEPDLSRIFPEATAAPALPGAPAPQPAAPTQVTPSDPIRGSVRLPDGHSDSTPGGAILFIIARTAGAAAGPPLAVVRASAPEFPFEFEIGQNDVMVPGLQFKGPLSVSARLDSDGNVMTRLPGDLQGAAAAALEPGMTDVVLMLDKKI